MNTTKTYLGDGLYAEYDGYQIRLFAHNGAYATNEVFLEPEVLDNFLKFVEKTFKVTILIKQNESEVVEIRTEGDDFL